MPQGQRTCPRCGRTLPANVFARGDGTFCCKCVGKNFEERRQRDAVADEAHDARAVAFSDKIREELGVPSRRSKPFMEWTKNDIDRDPIGALFRAAKDSGLSVELHGEPVTEYAFRRAAAVQGAVRLAGHELTPEEMSLLAKVDQ